MKNLKEFKALIIRYETITIEEIEKAYCDKTELTGFGSMATCTLCKTKGINILTCSGCIYFSLRKKSMACVDNSYRRLDHARTSKEIFKAFRNRAAHMRNILKKLNIEM